MLNFYNCVCLLSDLVNAGMIQKDPANSNNILIYREAGQTSSVSWYEPNYPEGWYSENLFETAQELYEDADAQQFLLSELQKKTGKAFTERKL